MGDTAVPFKSILCGVEGNPSSTEAASQAITLAGDGGAVHFLAVYTSFELGPDYTRETLRESLDNAARMAEDAGITATTDMRDGRYAVEVLLSEGEKHDLLVIGTHGRSRAAGFVMGSTASEAAHRTTSPLLIAREPPGSSEFPSEILFAGDGSEGSWPAARAAARIAATFDARLDALHVDDGKHPDAETILEAQLAEFRETTGGEVPIEKPNGHATDQIIEAVKGKGSSLIVCGRRGLTGIKALGSVSERVAHQAGCSVLLVPAPGDG